MLRNSFFMLLSTLARSANRILLFLFLARFLGPKGFGDFSFAFALSAVLALAIDYGYQLRLVREMSAQPEESDKIFWRALAVRLISTLLIVGGTILWHFFVSPLYFNHPLFLPLFLSAIFGSFAMFFNLVFRARMEFHRESGIVLLGNGLIFIAVIFQIFRQVSAHEIAVTHAVFNGLYLLISAIALRGVLRFELPKVREIASEIRGAFPFAFQILLGGMLFSIDKFLVYNIAGNYSLGIYDSGLRILMIGLFFTDFIPNAYLPLLSRLMEKREQLADAGRKFTRHLVASSTLAAIGIAAAGPKFVTIIFGTKYESVIPFLPAFSLVLLLRAFAISQGTLLTAAKLQSARAIGVLLSLFVAIFANLILLPHIGVSGALYASIATHITLALSYAAFTLRNLHSHFLERSTIFLLVFGGIFSLFCFFIPEATKLKILLPALSFVAVMGSRKLEWEKVFSLIRRK